MVNDLLETSFKPSETGFILIRAFQSENFNQTLPQIRLSISILNCTS